MGNGGFYCCSSEPQGVFSVVEGNSTNMYYPKCQSALSRTLLHFRTFVETAGCSTVFMFSIACRYSIESNPLFEDVRAKTLYSINSYSNFYCGQIGNYLFEKKKIGGRGLRFRETACGTLV